MDEGSKPSSSGSTIIRWLEELGRARDGMIVALAAVYILGFLSWSLYSLRSNIGFIRVFDAQYLIGGLPPALSIALAALAWTFARSWLFSRLALASFSLGCLVLVFMLDNDLTDYPWNWQSDRISLFTATLAYVAGLLAVPGLVAALRAVTPLRLIYPPGREPGRLVQSFNRLLTEIVQTGMPAVLGLVVAYVTLCTYLFIL